MDSFQFAFDTDSTMTNDTTSTNDELDWTAAFQSAPPTINIGPFSPNWLPQQDDAVAPDNRTNFIPNNVHVAHDDGIYFEIESLFPEFNQQNLRNVNNPVVEQEQTQIQPVQISLQTNNVEINDFDASQRIHQQSAIRQERTNSSCLPAPLVPRVSSSRSQCYHKLPDHAVKLMQEWYNANLDDPYPRSPDKKRFITEGNITAQQCRSWFANRRQRLKHVKRNHPRASSSNSFSTSPSPSTSISRLQMVTHQTRLTAITPPSTTPPTTPPTTTTTSTTTTTPTRPNGNIEEQAKTHEHCYYCQQSSQQPISPSSLPLTFTSNPNSTSTSATTTTLNVVINQQTVEQLIHNSLRKLLYPTVM